MADEWKFVFRDEIDVEIFSEYELTAEESGIRCLRCGKLIIFSPCHNCGSGKLAYSQGEIYCRECKMGFSSLECECGCVNPIAANTLVKKADVLLLLMSTAHR